MAKPIFHRLGFATAASAASADGAFPLSHSALSLGRSRRRLLFWPCRCGLATERSGVLHSVCMRPSATAPITSTLPPRADLLGPAISNCQLSAAQYRPTRCCARLRTSWCRRKRCARSRTGRWHGHEFNNALCGALGFIELTLRNSNLPPSALHQLESARICCFDARQTVARVQDFARWKRDGHGSHYRTRSSGTQTIDLARHKWRAWPTPRHTHPGRSPGKAQALIARQPRTTRGADHLVFNAVGRHAEWRDAYRPRLE